MKCFAGKIQTGFRRTPRWRRPHLRLTPPAVTMATPSLVRPCRWGATLDRRHGAKTQKEIIGSARPACCTNSFFNLEPKTTIRPDLWSSHSPSKCSVSLRSSFWGCWPGRSRSEGPDPVLTRASRRQRPAPTAPSWPSNWSFLLRWWKTVRSLTERSELFC